MVPSSAMAKSSTSSTGGFFGTPHPRASMNVCTRARISSRIARAREIGSSRRSSRSHRSARGSGPAIRAGSSWGGARWGARRRAPRCRSLPRPRGGRPPEGRPPRGSPRLLACARRPRDARVPLGEPSRDSARLRLVDQVVEPGLCDLRTARVIGANEDDGMHGAPRNHGET